MATKVKTTATKVRASAPVVAATANVDSARRALIALLGAHATAAGLFTEKVTIQPDTKPKEIVLQWHKPGVKRAERGAKLEALIKMLSKDKQLPITAEFSPGKDEKGLGTVSYGGAKFTVLLSLPTANNPVGELKPTNFGVTGKEYKTIKVYQTAVADKLKTHPTNEAANQLLRLLLDAATNKNIHQAGVSLELPLQLTGGVRVSDLVTPWRAKIENDFGEVLGPVMVSSHPKFTNVSNVWFPTSQIEGAYDFKVDADGGKGLKFSSKAGSSKSPNTLKGKDIIPWFEEKAQQAKSPAAKKLVQEFRDSLEFKVLKVLSDNNANDGPGLAIKAGNLTDSYKRYREKKVPGKVLPDTLLTQSEYLAEASKPGSYTWQNKLNYRDLFLFVTSDNVLFIKTFLDISVKQGLVLRCSIFDPAGKVAKVKDDFRPVLRPKPLSAGKATEKIGVTPP